MLAEFTAVTRARRNELPARYYTSRRVRFIISPDPSGGWSIVPAGDGDGIFLPVPTVYRSGATPPPMLIADTALYVLGVPRDTTAAGQQAAAARHAGYTALIDSFAAASPDDPIAAQLAAFVHGPYPAALARRLTELGGTSADLVTFAINGTHAHQTPAAQAFWTAEVARRKGTGAEAVCCICGGTGLALASLPESIPSTVIPVTDSAGRPGAGAARPAGKHQQRRPGTLRRPPARQHPDLPRLRRGRGSGPDAPARRAALAPPQPQQRPGVVVQRRRPR